MIGGIADEGSVVRLTGKRSRNGQSNGVESLIDAILTAGVSVIVFGGI